MADSKDPEALRLLLMLHYTFWGTTMPPSAMKTLDTIVKEVHGIVSKAAGVNETVNLDWIYIGPETVKGIEPSLSWWMAAGKTVSYSACAHVGRADHFLGLGYVF